MSGVGESRGAGQRVCMRGAGDPEAGLVEKGLLGLLSSHTPGVAAPLNIMFLCRLDFCWKI